MYTVQYSESGSAIFGIKIRIQDPGWQKKSSVVDLDINFFQFANPDSDTDPGAQIYPDPIQFQNTKKNMKKMILRAICSDLEDSSGA
jgi:hypothetical protein